MHSDLQKALDIIDEGKSNQRAKGFIPMYETLAAKGKNWLELRRELEYIIETGVLEVQKNDLTKFDLYLIARKIQKATVLHTLITNIIGE